MKMSRRMDEQKSYDLVVTQTYSTSHSDTMRWCCTILFFLCSNMCAAATRRILHQPFFPLTTAPLIQPLSPPPSLSPFDLPFFPKYPSPTAPPPPTPSALATNISFLLIPRSHDPSHFPQKLLEVSLASSLSAIVLLIFVALYYHRRPCNHSRFASVKCNGKGFVSNDVAPPSPEIVPLPRLFAKPRFRDDCEDERGTNRASDYVDEPSVEASSVAKVDEDLLTSASEWDFSKRIFIGKETDYRGSFSPRSSSASDGRVDVFPSSSSLSSSLQVPPPPPPLPLNGSTSVKCVKDFPVDSPVEIVPRSFGVAENVGEVAKPKLKPLHWTKMRARSDREMVWDQLKSSSFKLDEELIESLFIENSNSNTMVQFPPIPMSIHENRVIDAKRAQNISILLRALNVTTEEVCDALLDGNSEALGPELLESLLKMAPTKEEERRLREFTDGSKAKLGQAEKFLKAILDIPLPFKRAEAMLFISNFETETEYLKKSFRTLELACGELRASRMLPKLLEAVLKTGNRMNVGTNRGDASSFKLNTLLNLADIKGVDGRTTLLHFVVQEIIRTEGNQAVEELSAELGHVKMVAGLDSKVVSGEVVKLSKGIEEISDGAKLMDIEGGKFIESIHQFLKYAEVEISKIEEHERVAMSLVKEITEYFHGDLEKEEAHPHPFRIFMVVRDFLGILERVNREVVKKTVRSAADKCPVPLIPKHDNADEPAL